MSRRSSYHIRLTRWSKRLAPLPNDCQTGSSKKQSQLQWVDKNVVDNECLGTQDTIAQVHPHKLCHRLWQEIENRPNTQLLPSKIVQARCQPTNDESDATDKSEYSITGVELEDGSFLETNVLVVACGPWTNEARSWFPPMPDTAQSFRIPEITSVKCHSMLIQPTSDKDSKPIVYDEAVFFESLDPTLLSVDAELEVYPRPDADCYVNGFEEEPGIIQERPGQEAVHTTRIEEMKQAMLQTSTSLGGIEPYVTQACYWPETPDGLPCIGPIPGIEGAYCAAGHSVWGILQGPITGKALSELILDGKSTSLDLTSFQLERFLHRNEILS